MGFFQSSPKVESARVEPEPIITPEADKAIFKVMLRYGMIAFALVVLLPVGYGIVYSMHPHSKIFGLYGPVAWVAAALWIVPWYIGNQRQSELRLYYARLYLQERRWKETAAAVNSFSEWGQRSFDRTGEAHYILSLALDKLGRKEKAETMRKFVRKHRSGTEWAVKCGGDPTGVASAASISAPSASHLRRKALKNEGGDETLTTGKHAKSVSSSGAASRGRRRRF